PSCNDWGESSTGSVSALDGEVSWLSCPLFSHPSVYNYSSGHNLFWYRLLDGHDLEQPITSNSRFSKDRERLWLQPAVANDTGQYICMLRNRTSCSKIAMRLKVLRRNETTQTGDSCEPPVAVAPSQVNIPLQSGKILDCPDLQDGEKMAENKMNESTMRVTWFHVRIKH
ncbi:interleukin-1 receptor accessory protein, partial [Scomber scombrus]